MIVGKTLKSGSVLTGSSGVMCVIQLYLPSSKNIFFYKNDVACLPIVQCVFGSSGRFKWCSVVEFHFPLHLLTIK